MKTILMILKKTNTMEFIEKQTIRILEMKLKVFSEKPIWKIHFC